MPKIMIVDDDPNISLLLEVTLRKNASYEIVKCNNGQMALDMIDTENPNLILLDIMMPGIDGFEVCKRIKQSEEHKFVSIIILSARRELQDKVKGMDIGADDYIVKPFNPDELIARVQAQLRIRELEKELLEKKQMDTVISMAVTLQHEINNPLTGILGNADLLKGWRTMDPKETDQSVNVIIEQTVRIRNLVEKLSKATRVVEATYIGNTKMIDINDLDKKDN